MNGSSITVSTIEQLGSALLVTGFAYDIRDTPNNNLNHSARFALKAQGLRVREARHWIFATSQPAALMDSGK